MRTRVCKSPSLSYQLLTLAVSNWLAASWIPTKSNNNQGFNQALHANNAEQNTERDVQT